MKEIKSYYRTKNKCFFKHSGIRIVCTRTSTGCYDIKPDKPIDIVKHGLFSLIINFK